MEWICISLFLYLCSVFYRFVTNSNPNPPAASFFESSRYCSAFIFSPKPLPEAPNTQPSRLPALEGWWADLTGERSLPARREFSLSPVLISVTCVSAFPLHWSIHLFWWNTPWSASCERDLQFWDLHPWACLLELPVYELVWLGINPRLDIIFSLEF